MKLMALKLQLFLPEVSFSVLLARRKATDRSGLSELYVCDLLSCTIADALNRNRGMICCVC